ncbi:MAG: DUF3987 domain-containing protein [Nitrospina sp.]|nr:DUF3987 domain-containing protein [Nitrospina sp.]MBT3876628.1 DUF3987 domain-containing protein [Nitrospina sp.]MBT4049687.1 DUF3987 domain-containing protein [Nitrospina sp.]MBT4556462.1 DUF3987 domain-containing protein [Nitrospina sp.]
MSAKEICSAIESAEVFGWEKPDFSILHSTQPACEFPVDVFEGELKDWLVLAAQKTSAPIDYLIGSLLAVVSSAIGNSRRISPWEGWDEPSILWIALIGNPSSGKSPAMGPAIDLLLRIERERGKEYEDRLKEFQQDKAIAEFKKEGWEKKAKEEISKKGEPSPMPDDAFMPQKPRRTRLVFKDATVESLCNALANNPKGALYVRDELSGLLGNFNRYGNGQGDRAFWLEVYGGRQHVVDRVKHDSPTVIPHLSVSVLGGIQPDKLRSSLFSGDDDGLHSRFLYMYPDPATRVKPDSKRLSDMMQVGVNKLYSLKMVTDRKGNAVPKTIFLTTHATDTFEKWWVENPKNQLEGLLAGWWGKLPGVVLRLALILEYLFWLSQNKKEEPEQITSDSINRAIRLIEDYFYPMAERAYGEVGITEKEKLAKILAKWILKNRPEIINTRSISREAKISELKKSKEVHIAIEHLQSLDWVQKIQTENGSAGGRKREDYRINPSVYI